MKKEPQHLDAVPEFAEPPAQAPGPPPSAVPAAAIVVPEARSKPRLQMTHSESSLTTFANGHHKPTHKHHGSFHGSSPYSIPTVGHTGHNFGEHSGCTKVQSASVPPPPSSLKSRRIKSEQSSPDLRAYTGAAASAGSGGGGGNSIAPLELTPRPPQQPPSQSKPPAMARATARGLSLNTNQQSFPSMPTFQNNQDMLASASSESGAGYLCSADLYPPQSAGWPPSFAPFDGSPYEDAATEFENYLRQHGAPPPVASNSSTTPGDERDEFVGYDASSRPRRAAGTSTGSCGGAGGGRPSPPAYGYGTDAISSSSSDQADSDHYHLSAASSYVTLPQSQETEDMRALASGGFDGSDFDRLMLVPPDMRVGGIDSFQPGLVTGPDALYDVDELNLGYSSPVGYGDLVPDRQLGAMVSKGMEAGTIPPPPDDEGLWMAPWIRNSGL